MELIWSHHDHSRWRQEVGPVSQVANAGWTTTGLDVTTNYGVHFDPFDTKVNSSPTPTSDYSEVRMAGLVDDFYEWRSTRMA